MYNILCETNIPLVIQQHFDVFNWILFLLKDNTSVNQNLGVSEKQEMVFRDFRCYSNNPVFLSNC